mmetsp:Transcript_23004/g.71649  ORF Transcript_23004/g.71649 Transcript_23004/m.71649 type:complete len:454 (+) Transcript_23004:307-1668(+)
MVGGLYSVIVTEIVQTLVLCCAAFITCGVALGEVGGYEGLVEKVPPQWLTLLHDGGGFDLNPYPYRWFSMLMGLPFLTLFFHTADQEMVQRGLSARDLAHGQAGCVAGGFLKIIPPLMFVFPGVIARVLDHEKAWGDLGCPEPFKGPCENADRAFPMLVNRLLPPGLLGVVLGAMLAALMSSMSAVFNSTSTIFTMDIFPLLRGPRPTMTAPPPGGSPDMARDYEALTRQAAVDDDKLTVRVGRLAAVVACLVGMLWVPVLKVMPAGLYDFIQSLAAAIGPPILMVFSNAIMIRARLPEAAAIASLAAGHTTAALFLIARASGWASPGGQEFLDDFVLCAVFPALASGATLALYHIAQRKAGGYVAFVSIGSAPEEAERPPGRDGQERDSEALLPAGGAAVRHRNTGQVAAGPTEGERPARPQGGCVHREDPSLHYYSAVLWVVVITLVVYFK